MSASIYHQTKHRRINGLVEAERASKCFHCGGLAPFEQLHKGWCLACVTSWAKTADPWLIVQARKQLPENVVPSQLIRRVEAVRDGVIDPAVRDEDFLALTQFMGAVTVGRARPMWNILQLMYRFELQTTGQLALLTSTAPNLQHLCGRHSKSGVQRMSVSGFLSRVRCAGQSAFPLFWRDPHLVDYANGFVSDNRLLLYELTKTSVDVFGNWQLQKSYARYGKPHFDKHCPQYWPFEGDYDSKQREDGTREELPDIVMQIGALVPTKMPESLREDICQDLVVAVLSGETTIENLRGSMRHYVREAFKHHPLKYGRYSLDQPSSWLGDDGDEAFGRTLTNEDTDPARADRGWLRDLCVDPDAQHRGWHEGHERPVGLAPIGEILRDKHNGYAIEGPLAIPEEPGMDPEVAEVFHADQHPRWRHKLSD